MLAHSYYTELIEAGVKIYEYLPGFVHQRRLSAMGRKLWLDPSIWISEASI